MVIRLSIVLVVCLATVSPAAADAMLFRVFLRDGSSVVSYGEMARVNDQVIFSMPVGGTREVPRLLAVTLASDLVDWTRTDRHSASARYLNYVDTRAETDYDRLVTGVAVVLNRIAQTTDRDAALALAEKARRTLVDWPRAHFGYRQDEVRDIVTHLDQAISRLRGSGTIELSFFSTVPPIPVEAIATMPGPAEQLDQLVRILRVTPDARDRISLLQAGLMLLAESDPATLAGREPLHRTFDRQLRYELAVDERYARLSRQLVARASRAAAVAKIADVERVVDAIGREDAKLGQQRPAVIQAVRNSVEVHLAAARRLRLLRDQWEVRRDSYRAYQRAAGTSIVQLVKAQAALDDIRRLDGPSPKQLETLRSRLSGGAERLQRVLVPEDLRGTHELVVGAWRFAETAARARLEAVSSGSLATAWEASSAAAGALMMLSRAQQRLREFLEPPKLQ
jgi:hypothetical protein